MELSLARWQPFLFKSLNFVIQMMDFVVKLMILMEMDREPRRDDFARRAVHCPRGSRHAQV